MMKWLTLSQAAVSIYFSRQSEVGCAKGYDYYGHIPVPIKVNKQTHINFKGAGSGPLFHISTVKRVF